MRAKKAQTCSKFCASVCLMALGEVTTAQPEKKGPNIDFVTKFTSLCIEDSASGFNWDGRRWINAPSFKADGRYLAEKVDLQKINSDTSLTIIEKPTGCFAPKMSVATNEFYMVEACYLIRKVGRRAYSFDYEMCREYIMDKKLTNISCSKITFLPNGQFIHLPSLLDISERTEKDSLVLSVGMCSTITR